jgi:hypothetical protein
MRAMRVNPEIGVAGGDSMIVLQHRIQRSGELTNDLCRHALDHAGAAAVLRDGPGEIDVGVDVDVGAATADR